MKLDDLRPAPGADEAAQARGPGPGSGHGKTSTKGTRATGPARAARKAGGFEGGQMPLYRRLPKRGFTPYGGKTEYAVVNLKALGGVRRGQRGRIPTASLKAGLIKRRPRAGQGAGRRRRAARAHRSAHTR